MMVVEHRNVGIKNLNKKRMINWSINCIENTLDLSYFLAPERGGRSV